VSKEIWLAPILSDNRERLLERASDVLASGPDTGLLYLAASRPLLELAADRLLDGVRNRGVWGSLPVHLFRGFARYVLATAVDNETRLTLAPRIAIDQQDLPLKRSLVSQIIKRLASEGKLTATATLAHREGCINSIASLIGEIQRAGKRPAEFAAIVEARGRDYYEPDSEIASQTERSESVVTEPARQVPALRQIDFDRDIAVIYSAYASALDDSGFTEDDADQLRALDVLRGEVDGRSVSVPCLTEVRLLVLDGFFDFTPVQGEMLRLLIPRIPEVIVNLNRDESNAEVFRAFSTTIGQLESIATFETKVHPDRDNLTGALGPLRARLFNPLPSANVPTELESPERDSSITILECSSRQTEIRAIAKRIKQLVLVGNYHLKEIAVVVRELAAYSDTIARVFEEESIPCALQHRVQLADVPAARAAVKLFELLIEMNREGSGTVKVSALADLIKSGYFRLTDAELDSLRTRFTRINEQLVNVTGYRSGQDDSSVGYWDADELENVIAFVGAELRLDHWVNRARQLTTRAPEPAVERDSKSDDEDGPDTDESAVDAAQDARVVRRFAMRTEPVEVPLPGSERKIKPARDIHPAVIAWSSLVVERVGQMLTQVPREARASDLRRAVIRLLEQLQFSEQVRGGSSDVPELEISALALDLRALEGLRRALSAAARSIAIAEHGAVEKSHSSPIRLGILLDETMRSVKAQSLILSGADAGGLKVLEATDVRGLRFRAVFIAGLVEGGFPLRVSRDWIYPHEERDRLKRYGLTLEDISPQTLLKEEHYFYQAACRATERLYLSRPLVSDDGAETVASYYVEELVHAVSPFQVEKVVVRNDYDGHSLFEASRISELATLLVRQEERRRHRAQTEGNFPEAVIGGLLSMARGIGYLSDQAMRRIEIERERGGRFFGKFDGIVTDSKLLDRLAQQYGDHDFSASELSLYGRCPFKFFAEKLLRLEPRGEAALDLSALDSGSLLHEVLRRFFERHRGERLTGFDKAGLRRELAEVADAVFDEHEQSVPPLNPQVWIIDREIRKLLLEQVLDYELSVEAKTQSKEVRPAYFELAFGMQGGPVDPHSTEQRLRVYRASGGHADTLLLRGQIDRVDVSGDNKAVAYDYKLSRGPSLDDMREGRALQLHIYLSALEQLLLPGHEIAGGGYYTMKGAGGRRNQGLYRLAMKEYTGVGPTTSSSLEDEDWKRIRSEMESRIWEFVDGMRAGRFEVAPSAPDSTCPHCDYSAVCRYEKFRIRGKTDDR
jgi:ATP-dependent helicase/DNAse subunit B